MNRLTRNVYLPALVAALVIAGCGRVEGRLSEKSRATVTRNWPAEGIRELRVFEVSGSISVEPSATNEISLLATARGDLDLDPAKENQGLFDTTLDGGTLRIGRKQERRRGWNIGFFFDNDDVRIDYVLKVPPAVMLDATTVNGRIATRGMEGETEASTVNGSIDVEVAGTHELRATSVNGRVKAKFTESFRGARFKSVNGGVEAFLPKDASFTVNLSQVNGDFEATFPLSIRSNPGSRRVSGEVNGGEYELKITTVNGDVELARLNGL
jgi:hypothetical protein